MMFTINYTRHGWPYGDHEAEAVVLRLYEGIKYNINNILHTSTENVVDAARALIAEGKLSIETVRFTFEGVPVGVNEYGSLLEHPHDFCDVGYKLTVRILKGAIARKKLERQIRGI